MIEEYQSYQSNAALHTKQHINSMEKRPNPKHQSILYRYLDIPARVTLQASTITSSGWIGSLPNRPPNSLSSPVSPPQPPSLLSTYMMHLWCFYDAFVIFVWCICDVFMMHLWCFYDAFEMFLWGIYVFRVGWQDKIRVWLLLVCWCCVMVMFIIEYDRRRLDKSFQMHH